MRQGCENPKSKDFSYYGARGVRVCKRWQSFLAFLADKGVRPPGLTLDRVNPYGNYEPRNTRWVSRAVQRHNWRKHHRKAA
jgi:hypothetical protein